MRAKFILWTWIALLVPVVAVAIGESTRPAASGTKENELRALENKLLGKWRGPACGGNYHFSADGTFELTSFTPGGNTLTGTWSMRWYALPPTLVLHTTTSDFTKVPNRDEFEYLNKDWELKLIELDDKTLAYRVPANVGNSSPKEKRERRFERFVAADK
jgi:hypothetical protein